MRVSCPPHKWPCAYGIDFPTRKELMAANNSLEQIREFLGADSLGYLSLDGMIAATGSAGHRVLHRLLHRQLSVARRHRDGQVHHGTTPRPFPRYRLRPGTRRHAATVAVTIYLE